MKNKEKNTDRIIQRKIKNYEFEFSDHAWDKMEAQLANTPPATRSNNFFNIRNLMIMLLLLVILLMGVLGTYNPADQPATAAIPTKTLIETSNPQLQEETELQTLPTPVLSTTNETNWVNTKKTNEARKITKKFPEVFASTLWQLPFPVVKDSTFQEKLQQQLSNYYDHYSPDKVYLHFDRKFFKPGENIWFSAYVRDANTLKASTKSEMVYVELLNPNGGVLKTIKLIARNGHVKGDFKLERICCWWYVQNQSLHQLAKKYQ